MSAKVSPEATHMAARRRQNFQRSLNPRSDRDAIARVAAAVAIGIILTDRREISELEINPLRVNSEGVLALDALVVLDNRARGE